MKQFEFADIVIRKSGDIVSPDFDDVYFSPSEGYMESLHVFMQPNDIPSRFFKKKALSIFETGFGTGLNFLITLKLFKQFAGNDSTLEYRSIEKFPVNPCMIDEIYKEFYPLRKECMEFSEKYVSANLQYGLNSFSFYGGKVKLDLIIDDIINIRSHEINDVDIWFLDGFNPSKNPDMWNDEFLGVMREKSAENATFSTFSAAGFLRKRLASNGFKVEKIKGFHKKREMIKGYKDIKI